MDDKKEPSVSNTTKWLMFWVAIFFDVLSLFSLIPFIGWIFEFLVGFYAFMTFWTWFMINGTNIIGFRNPKKMIASILSSFIELTPLGFIPSWTILILYLTRVEKIINKTVSVVPGVSNVVKFIPKNPKKKL